MKIIIVGLENTMEFKLKSQKYWHTFFVAFSLCESIQYWHTFFWNDLIQEFKSHNLTFISHTTAVNPLGGSRIGVPSGGAHK